MLKSHAMPIFYLVGLFAIAFAAPQGFAADAPTFTKDIAPIFVQRCVACHRPGEIAPMSLMTFDETRPWAKSIRQKVANREMPPWDADPAFGSFRNDISLKQEDIDTIVSWVDAGTPRGDMADMPPMPEFSDTWKLGEPDYVIDMGAFDIPADAEDIFITKAVRLDMPEKRWIRAVEVQPGDRQVLHHLVGFKGFFEMGEGGANVTEGITVRPDERRDLNVFSIWAAGTPPTEFAKGMGHEFTTDQLLSFSIHYHPYGTETRDESKVGLYFGEGELAKQITAGFALNTGIQILPDSMSKDLRASYVFNQDVQLVSFFPHMHQRGKSMTYTLTRPTGETETLLRVPDYDFNWQWLYFSEEPIDVPAGSRLDVVANWDNRASNLNNPDPSQVIEFGAGTNYEMLIGFFDFIPKEGRDPKPAPPAAALDALMAVHPSNESYKLSVGGMDSMALGLHLPASGDATVYLIEGSTILTMTARDVDWISDHEAIFNAKVVRDAGRTIPFGVYADVANPADVKGHVYIGRPAPKKPDASQAVFQFTGHGAG